MFLRDHTGLLGSLKLKSQVVVSCLLLLLETKLLKSSIFLNCCDMSLAPNGSFIIMYF